MAAFLDICRFNPSAGGVADWIYASPVTGYQSLGAAGAVNGRLYKYRAESADLSQWELGEGAYNSGTGTLARTTILSNSSGTTSRINFLAPPQVAVVALKADLIGIEEDNIFTDAQKAQARKNIYAAPFDSMLSNGFQANGAMEISQENGSSLGALGTGNVYYAADQFFVASIGGQVLGAQNVADAPAGLSRSIKVTVTTANASPGSSDTAHIRTKIEGYRCAKLGFGSAGAQSLSIGFWVKANRTGAYTGCVRNGAANRSYPFAYSISASGTWEFKTLTVPGDVSGTWLKDNGVGLDIFWMMAGGSAVLGTAGAWAATSVQGATGQINGVGATSDTFQLTGVIILAGTELPTAARSATVMRPFDQELSLCKRYWEKSYDYSTAPGSTASAGLVNAPYPSNTVTANADYPSVSFSIAKRVAPTVTCYGYFGTAGKVSTQNGAELAAGSGVAGAVGENSFINRNQSGGSLTLTNNIVYFHWTANARL